MDPAVLWHCDNGIEVTLLLDCWGTVFVVPCTFFPDKSQRTLLFLETSQWYTTVPWFGISKKTPPPPCSITHKHKTLLQVFMPRHFCNIVQFSFLKKYICLVSELIILFFRFAFRWCNG